MSDSLDLIAGIACLRALSEQAGAADLSKFARVAPLERLPAPVKQAAFGKRSERADPDHVDLAPEEIGAAMPAVHAEEGAEDRKAQRRAKKRNANRGALPADLPRCGGVVEPDSQTCAGGAACIAPARTARSVRR